MLPTFVNCCQHFRYHIATIDKMLPTFVKCCQHFIIPKTPYSGTKTETKTKSAILDAGKEVLDTEASFGEALQTAYATKFLFAPQIM